jgi:hypothetical protein
MNPVTSKFEDLVAGVEGGEWNRGLEQSTYFSNSYPVFFICMFLLSCQKD